tara:strand:+ start:3161 stop:3529 length:369 start_codon:yes stop_codon:yes gene_type:complete
MLIKDFYKIIALSSDDSGIVATIKLNPNHEVYKGHFPNQPIVPGVIQLLIIQELMEKHLGKKLFMGSIKRVKYLIPIIPTNSPQLVFTITINSTDESKIRSTITIGLDNSIFTKAKMEFTIT